VENELIVIEELNPIEVFTNGGVEEVLQKIKIQVSTIVPDVETAKGRKEIASVAHKVARSKTALDELGKSLVEEQKKKLAKVDAERKKVRDFLDDLKEEVRKPLTDWENAEAERVQRHKDNLEEIQQAGEYSKSHWIELSAETIRDRLMEIEAEVIDSSWDEFEQEAAQSREIALEQLRGALEMRKNHDREQAELAELRAQNEARAKADEEERLRKEGEERARAVAEAAQMRAVREAEEARIAAEEAKAREEQAKKDAAEAAERAEREKIAAAERAREEERQRQAEAQRKEEEAAKAREADKKHRGKVNKAAKEAIIALGIEAVQAQAVVEAIVRGSIPNVSIKY